MSINFIDKPIYDAPKTRDRLRLASESAEEEFTTFELPIIIKEFDRWKLENPDGTWDDFKSLYLGSIEEEATIKVAELPKNKINEILKIKKIDLMPDFYKLMDSLSKLDSTQRKNIHWLLEKTLGKKK